MALQLAPEEPEAGPWRAELLSTVVETMTRREPGNATPSRPVVLAVDGRSNAGKTTLAARICRAVPGSAVVHTDDIAWKHSRFGWADLLIEGILQPVHQGRAVSYRPPRWAEHGREGSIEVPADCPLLVIEGDGAGRQEAADLIDALIWVQSDESEAERRVLARIGKPNEAPTLWHHREWMAEERPFNIAQRTWERADVIVCGTPQIPCDPLTEIVLAPPLTQLADPKQDPCTPGRPRSPEPEITPNNTAGTRSDCGSSLIIAGLVLAVIALRCRLVGAADGLVLIGVCADTGDMTETESLIAEVRLLRADVARLHAAHAPVRIRHGWMNLLLKDLSTNPYTQYKVHMWGAIYWLINFPLICCLFFFTPTLWVKLGIFITLIYSIYSNLATDYGAMSSAEAAFGEPQPPPIPLEPPQLAT